MTTHLIVPLVLIVVLSFYVAIAWRTWVRVHGTRVVVCPETQRPVAVNVDVGHAMTTSVWEKPDLRLTSCSRWPERADCDQPCVKQIELLPDATRPQAIATQFFAAQCRRPAARLHGSGFAEGAEVGRGPAAGSAGCGRHEARAVLELHAGRVVPGALPGSGRRSAAALTRRFAG
jgi:hypothetical protein